MGYTLVHGSFFGANMYSVYENWFAHEFPSWEEFMDLIPVQVMALEYFNQSQGQHEEEVLVYPGY